MIMPNIKNETGQLKLLVLGTSLGFGGVPKLDEAYDPKSKEHIRNNSYPNKSDIQIELSEFESVLLRYNVKVLRPREIENYNQVFARDIAYVIDDKLVIANMLQDRSREIEAIHQVIEQIPKENILKMPNEAKVEGGDVMPWNQYLFMGCSNDEDFEKYTVARSNIAGLVFLKENFTHKEVIAFELNKSDDDPRYNALHLDCCFQPIGEGNGIIFPDGFKYKKSVEVLYDIFGKENLIEITREEMYEMNCNVFSISPEVVVSDVRFERLNNTLVSKGFKVEAIRYGEIAKMEGLLRCSTLPLIRE